MKDYKKILEGVVNIINTAEKSDIGFTNICTYIGENCPELKEREDESIRKSLITFFQGFPYGSLESAGTNPKEAIAWLEKQGDKDKLIQELGEYKVKYTQEVLSRQLEKQGEPTDINPSEFDLRLNKLLKQFESLPKEELASSLSFYLNVVQNDGTYKADENQGDKNPCETCEEPRLNCQNFPCEKKKNFDSVNRVEPKFHEGDWITNGDYTWKIVEVKSLDYILQSQDGNIVDDTISHVDEQFHSFTIQDAKDGDVLACPLPKGYEAGEQIFIFKEINSRDYVENCIEYYCRVCEGEFYENETGYMGTTSSPIYPATKEQRDTLFAKMKEARYEWNAERKKLKKISQRMISAEAKEALYDKSAWSEG